MTKKVKSQNAAPRRRGLRVLPLTITMLSLLLVMKLNDLYINSRQLREVYGVRDAVAEEKKEAGHAAEEKPAEHAAGESPAATEGEHKEEAKAEGGHGGGDAKEKPPEEPKTFGAGKTTIKEIEALKAKDAMPMYTQAEIELLQNLSKRRDELEKRNAELEMKAKLLEAGEKRLDDKMVQMKALQAQLEKVVSQYNEKESMQIKSLVKIYENMKPGDAANIFNQMDMPILLEVIDKMSERKVAPVLAAMDPKKAKDVTQELAEMRRNVGAAGGAARPTP